MSSQRKLPECALSVKHLPVIHLAFPLHSHTHPSTVPLTENIFHCHTGYLCLIPSQHVSGFRNALLRWPALGQRGEESLGKIQNPKLHLKVELQVHVSSDGSLDYTM